MKTDQRIWTHWGFTLVDITATGVTQWSENVDLERNQQRNWETVQQILGLKTQIFRIDQVKSHASDIKKLQFGNYYMSEVGFKYNFWAFEFDVEYQDAYIQGPDPFGVLTNDFENVPIILGLEETAPPPPQPVFYTQGPYKNIHFITRPYPA